MYWEMHAMEKLAQVEIPAGFDVPIEKFDIAAVLAFPKMVRAFGKANEHKAMVLLVPLYHENFVETQTELREALAKE